MLGQCDLMSFELSGSVRPHSSLLGDVTGLRWYTLAALASSALAAAMFLVLILFLFLLLFYYFIDACLQPL